MGKRVMLKISGEQLGSETYNLDMQQGFKMAEVVKALVDNGYQVAIVVGGGNIIRGNKLHANGFTNLVIADQMGMLAGVQNGLFLTEVLKQAGVENAYLFTNLPIESVSERFSYKRATSHLDRGGVVIISGGLGKPGFTHDTAAVVQAFELHCEIVIKTTKVDGVYNKDPEQFPDALRYDTLTYQEALSNPDIQVMDKTGLAMAADKKITIGVCQPEPDKVLALLNGDTSHGTLVKD